MTIEFFIIVFSSFLVCCEVVITRENEKPYPYQFSEILRGAVTGYRKNVSIFMTNPATKTSHRRRIIIQNLCVLHHRWIAVNIKQMMMIMSRIRSVRTTKNLVIR